MVLSAGLPAHPACRVCSIAGDDYSVFHPISCECPAGSRGRCHLHAYPLAYSQPQANLVAHAFARVHEGAFRNANRNPSADCHGHADSAAGPARGGELPHSGR